MIATLLCAVTVAKSSPVVLTYHDMVAKRDSKALWFDCTPKELESQLDWLGSKGARFVSVRTVYDYLRAKKPTGPKAVAITFADNYEGFYTLAWPILKRRKVPVALFVHTGFVGSRQGRPKMSWVTLRELAKSPLVTICSQTVTHPADLTKLSDGQLRKEFTASKAALVSNLGAAFGADILAYPNGKYDARVAKIAAKTYLMAFTEAQKPIDQAPDLWRVPRYVHTKYRQAFRDGNPG